MADGNNTKIIDACIQEFKDANELALSPGDLFELFVGIQVSKDQDLAAEDIQAAIVDGAGDGGIDLFLLLLDDQPILTKEDAAESSPGKQSMLTLLVSQAKHEASFREAVLDKWITSMAAILDLDQSESALAKRFNPALLEKIIAFRAVLFSVSRKGGAVAIRYVYATRANEFISSPAFDSKLEQLQADTRRALPSAVVAASCLSARELFLLYRADTPERRDLTFSGNPLATTYREGIGYVGLVPLHALKSFITAESGQIDERVFESNVRHFQGNVDVNSKIRKTVRDDQERDFWWLNNGVTIVSPAATPLGNSLTITNPQIVNGLQTSYSIFETLQDVAADARCVLVKVIVSSDKATIDKVISATNSQTAVGAVSLRATDDVQRQLEAYFESKGYYYDRRKNYYKNRGKPISRIFGIAYVAQAIHSVLNRSPASARARPTSLMKDEYTYQSIFDPAKDFQAYLNSCVVVQMCRGYVSGLGASRSRLMLPNYVFHLAQISTAFALGNAHYTAHDVGSLALGRISVAMPEAAEWLVDVIETHLKTNKFSNFITLSKSVPFSEHINAALHDKLKAKKGKKKAQ
ncbi:MAG TPA: AIPR family protein [Xanthomonadaceae bacterium]